MNKLKTQISSEEMAYSELETDNFEKAADAQKVLASDAASPENIATPEALIKDYRFIRELGEGTNGKTYLAVSRVSQQKVAVKALKFVDKFKSLELFEREAATLSHVHVPGVPEFLGYVKGDADKNECYIIQEYFDYPSLQDLIEEKAETGEVFSEQETLAIMFGMANILMALQTHYSPPIIHRDIKPSNILYDSKHHKVMLIDFGAVANPAKRTEGSTVAGTLGYMAPEQLMGDCSIQADYYALGATALHLMTGIPPVEMGYDVSDPFLLKFEEPLKSHGVSDEMIALIGSLISPEIEKRPANANALQEKIKDECNRAHKVAMKHVKRWQKKLMLTVFSSVFLVMMSLLFMMSFIQANGMGQSWLSLFVLIAWVVFVLICIFIGLFCYKKYRKESHIAHKSIDLVNRYLTRLEPEKSVKAQTNQSIAEMDHHTNESVNNFDKIEALTMYRKQAFEYPDYSDYSEYVYEKNGQYYYYLSKTESDNIVMNGKKIKVIDRSNDDVKE